VPARGGPAFLVGRNFDTLYSYNASENYALAIAQLSNLVGGTSAAWTLSRPGHRRSRPVAGAEPRAANPAAGARARHRQGRRHDRRKTREAIKAEQQRLGLKTDGRAGQKLLGRLRAGG
jgi:hypothetical protein